MNTQRPTSLPGLLRAATPLLLRRYWRQCLTAIIALTGSAWLLSEADSCLDEGLRAGSFNIENFPKSPQQVAGAFMMLGTMDADVIAVQEITMPRVFSASVEKVMGSEWKFVYPERSPKQHVGILYDSERLTLKGTHTWREVAVYAGGKPAFEGRFVRKDTGKNLRVINVHFKYSKAGRSIRQKQFAALTPIVQKAVKSGDEVILLGDFNATEAGDRKDLAELAKITGMTWSSKKLECTSYWKKPGGCTGTALDHVLTSKPADDINAGGPCESEGCSPGQQCPIFHKHISDHCPVTVDVP